MNTRLIALLMIVTAFALAGCGSKSSSSSPPAATSTSTTPAVHFAKTKFILHVGLAGGAFHRYIYKPFKAGAFAHPLLHKLALVKAAVAALFVVHELKLAATDVKASRILSALFSPITALAAKVSAVRSELLGGHPSASDLDAVQSGGGSVVRTAAADGYPAPDINAHIPGIPGS